VKQLIRKKNSFTILFTAITAILSGLILYETMVTGSLLEETGLLGMFFASMFSHLTVIGRHLFLPAFLSLSLLNNPLLLGFSAGLGGAIGELTTYYCGLGIKETLEKDDNKDDDFSKWVRKYGFIAIFIVAASPLPDTPVALLFGSSRFPFKKFLIIEILGKTLYYSLGAALGGLFFTEIGNIIGETFLSIIIFGGSTLLVILTSWSKSRNKIFTFLRRFLP